jgi:hypothetical protein
VQQAFEPHQAEGDQRGDEQRVQRIGEIGWAVEDRLDATLDPNGALRGTAGNLAASVGTALIGALVVGVLSAAVMSNLTANPIITTELKEQVNLDSINFLSNDRLKERLQRTTATPEQVAEAVRVNEEARLRALKIGFFVLGCLALLSIFPVGQLPDYKPGDIPAGQPQVAAARRR